jgi:antitoxin VapB
MSERAKLFNTGGSQAVRLPKAFRFKADEVYIRRNALTGDITLSERPSAGWQDFFALIKTCDVPADFMTDRTDPAPERTDLF